MPAIAARQEETNYDRENLVGPPPRRGETADACDQPRKWAMLPIGGQYASGDSRQREMPRGQIK